MIQDATIALRIWKVEICHLIEIFLFEIDFLFEQIYCDGESALKLYVEALMPISCPDYYNPVCALMAELNLQLDLTHESKQNNRMLAVNVLNSRMGSPILFLDSEGSVILVGKSVL